MGRSGLCPVHRICDACGSAWDLHPISFGPTLFDSSLFRYMPGKRVRKLASAATADAPKYVRFVDGPGFIVLDPVEPLGESGHTWGDLLALVTCRARENQSSESQG